MFVKITSFVLAVSIISGCSTTFDKKTIKHKNDSKTVKSIPKDKAPNKTTRTNNEKKVYLDSENVSYLGDNKELKMVYGVKGGRGFYQIKNNDKDSYLITVVFNDDSKSQHEVKPYSLTEEFYYPLSNSIKNWNMKSWTTRERLDDNQNHGIRFGWRTFQGSQQFRLHNSSDKYIEVTYFYENEKDVKRTIKVMPNGVSNWQPNKGGNIITTIKTFD